MHRYGHLTRSICLRGEPKLLRAYQAMGEPLRLRDVWYAETIRVIVLAHLLIGD